MKNVFKFTGAVLLLTGLSGCVTDYEAGSRMAVREDINILREDLNRTQGRVETVELENQRLASEYAKLKTTAADARNQALMQERLDNLERQIQAMNQAREKDKQIIVDQLSTKIVEIMNRPVARSGEHIVAAGETLSSIALAYKVKVNAIMEANALQNPNSLRIGQRLIIPK